MEENMGTTSYVWNPVKSGIFSISTAGVQPSTVSCYIFLSAFLGIDFLSSPVKSFYNDVRVVWLIPYHNPHFPTFTCHHLRSFSSRNYPQLWNHFSRTIMSEKVILTKWYWESLAICSKCLSSEWNHFRWFGSDFNCLMVVICHQSAHHKIIQSKIVNTILGGGEL